MSRNRRLAPRAAFAAAVLCTGLLVYIMAAMPIHREPIFLDRGTIAAGPETIVLIGFVCLLLFNIGSLLWLASRSGRTQAVRQRERWVAPLGVFCLMALLGEKALVDEIGRELPLGREAAGEWIVLYLLLAVQLFYNVVIARGIHREPTLP